MLLPTKTMRTLAIASIFNLTLMNIDRYIAIKHSLKYKTLVTRGRLLRGSAFAWAVSFLLTVPLSFTYNDIYLVVSTITGCLCMAIITFCQIVILQETRTLKKRIAAHQVSPEDRKKLLKDKKAFQLTTIILFVLVLTYLPMFVVRILITNSIIYSLNASHIALMSAIFSSILNSLINPIIYCTKIRKFRVAFIEVLFRKTTIQAENTEKRMFGSLNKVAPLKTEEQQPRQQQTTANGSDTASDAASTVVR